MKSASRVAASTLGAYAGLLGAVHGCFEMRQGNIIPSGLMINAIGPPCQADTAAHACFPAMTVIPNLLVTGIAAVSLSLFALIWAAGFVQRKHSGLVLMLLSILMLLVGAGFIPTFVGIIAGVAGLGIHVPSTGWRARLPENALRFVARLWPWPIVAYLLWVFPVQWLLDHFFNAFLLNASLILFFFFDLGLPLLTVLTGYAHDILRTGEISR